MKSLRIVTCLCLTLWIPIATACAGAVTLDQCLAIALAQNAKLQASRQRIEAATGRAIQARLWPNPEVEVIAEEVPIQSGGLSRSKNLLGVTQSVPFPGKKNLDARIGRQGIITSEWEYWGAEIELIRDVKTTFYRVLASQKRLEVSEQLIELARSLSEAAGRRVEAGAAGDQERLRAEIEMERVAVELTAARSELVQAQKNLARLMGQPRETIGPLAGELPENVSLPDWERARDEMLSGHPTIRAALAGRQRAELELRRARLEPWPDLTFGVAGGRDAGENETLMEFSISLPLPIFDRAQGRKRETRALAEIAKYDLTSTEQRLIQELDVLDARLHAAQEQVEIYRTRILPKSEEALRLVRGGFEAGKFGFIDLVDTQRTAAEARLTYADKLLELNTAQAELEALLLKNIRSPFPCEETKTE